MKTDNELIAEFMQFTPYDGVDIFTEADFQYTKSWDWLMPVVEKIDSLYDESFPGNEEFVRRILAKEKPFNGPYMDVIALPLATPIEEAHKAVVDFIKWYNQQTK